jgi:DNA-binding response OmpR family regulator
MAHVMLNHCEMHALLPADLAQSSNSDAPRKLLLLEDDDTFQDIIRDFLVSHGYDVVAVKNGVDGVREIMASDFEVIICDMMMPNLPGDMFYLAVERMRPHLCSRFIFITGLRDGCKVTDFVKKVNGTILHKPFHVDDLLEIIGFVQVKSGFQ